MGQLVSCAKHIDWAKIRKSIPGGLCEVYGQASPVEAAGENNGPPGYERMCFYYSNERLIDGG